MDRIAADLTALAAVPHRYAATDAERAMLEAVKARLPQGSEARVEGFVAHTSPAAILGLHLVLLLGIGVVGFWHPLVAVTLAALVTLSLLGEGTGRYALVRHVFPKAASYNLVTRQPAPAALGAIVLSTPLDIPTWRPLRRDWLRFRPFQAVFATILAMDALLVLRSLSEPWGPATLNIYVAALGVLAFTAAVGVVFHRLQGATGDGGGSAAVLELSRRFQQRPIPGVEVWFAYTGCSHAFQGGMEAFLALHARTLPEATLVVALDHPAHVPLSAAISEGPLFAQHHRPTGPALVERLRWAGVDVPAVDLGGVTDARTALVAGYRALALVGGDGEPTPESVQRVADVVENLARWYGEDLAGVAMNKASLEVLARATSEARAAQQARKRGRGGAASPDVTDPGEPEAEGRPAAGEGT